LGFGKSNLEFCGMGFQKFRAKHLFDGYTMRDDQYVLIMNEDSTVEEIVPLQEAGDDIQYYDGILSPGFINCHCHLELSHMKGKIPEHTGLITFLLEVVKNRNYSQEIIYDAIAKAEDEMLKGGIVAVGDICNTTFSIPQKTKGRIWYHNFIEATGSLPDFADLRFNNCIDVFKEFAKQYAVPVDSNSIVPHAPYSISEPLWEKIIGFPGNQLLTIHNQESAAENEWFLNKTGDFKRLYEELKMDVSFFEAPGTSSLAFHLPKFISNQQLLLVHNVATSEEDIAFAKTIHNKLFWCLCPNANLYISNQLPDPDLFIKNNCTIVVGTDSLASNHSLSILSELKTLHTHFPSIAIERLLTWATLNGAKALQMDSFLGSFEKGKKPGVTVLQEDLTTIKYIF